MLEPSSSESSTLNYANEGKADSSRLPLIVLFILGVVISTCGSIRGAGMVIDALRHVLQRVPYASAAITIPSSAALIGSVAYASAHVGILVGFIVWRFSRATARILLMTMSVILSLSLLFYSYFALPALLRPVLAGTYQTIWEQMSVCCAWLMSNLVEHIWPVMCIAMLWRVPRRGE